MLEYPLGANIMKKILLTLFLAIFICLPTHSEVIHLSVDDAIDLALENNLDLKSKKKRAEELKQEIKIANALKNPSFQSNLYLARIARGNASQLGLALPIEVGKRGIRKKIAKTNLEIMENEIRASEHNLKIEIMRDYFNVLYSKSVVHILKEREQLFEDMKTISAQKAKGSEIDVMQADMKHQRQLALLNRAKADLLIAQFELNKAMNIKNSDTMYDTIETSLFPKNLAIMNLNLLPYQMIENTAMQYSYALAIADNNILKSEQEITQAKVKLIPDVTVAGGYAYLTGHQDIDSGSYIGIGSDIPLLYQYQPEIKRAKIVLERSKTEKDSFENQLKFTLKEDYNKFKYAKTNMNHYKKILDESRTVLRTYAEQYKKGQCSLLNLLQVETMHQENIREYIGAMRVYYESYLDLMQNVGHDILLSPDL